MLSAPQEGVLASFPACLAQTQYTLHSNTHFRNIDQSWQWKTYRIEGNFQGAKFPWFLVIVGVNNLNSLTLVYYFFWNMKTTKINPHGNYPRYGSSNTMNDASKRYQPGLTPTLLPTNQPSFTKTPDLCGQRPTYGWKRYIKARLGEFKLWSDPLPYANIVNSQSGPS
jgi:hypothetical protein